MHWYNINATIYQYRATIGFFYYPDESKNLYPQNGDHPLTFADDYPAWQTDGLDETQLQQLYELPEQAQPYKFYVTEIKDILYEELEPCFSGTRSIMDTVIIPDNRIQLYPAERGSR